jgi:hypothetical protein
MRDQGLRTGSTITTSGGRNSALGYLTPAPYAANLSATCDRLRNPDQLRRYHCILLGEDEYLIAMSLTDALQDAGSIVVGEFASVEGHQGDRV